MEGTSKKMKALFVDGGPRRKNNTAQLLENAMKGASEAGAETSLVRLYDITFTGCRSCFACKLKNAKTDGVCAIKDGLLPVLEQARDADIIVIGSPVYFGYPTGEVRSFLERFLYPNITYNRLPDGSLPPPMRPKRTAMIFTMNANEEQMDIFHYSITLGSSVDHLRTAFGHSEVLYSCDTYQFSDYSRYDAGLFDPEHKRKHHEEQFPVDMQKAYELGKRLVMGDSP